MTDIDRYRIHPLMAFSLDDIDPNDRSIRGEDKSEAVKALKKISREINILKDKLRSEKKQKVLLLLQGMDASGKDGTVKHVFQECNFLNMRIASFKKPTEEELAHDYLWRVHQQVPRTGELTIFNRSHYEDVLIVKVKQWISEAECQRRYAQIRDFERLLHETGTTLIKCFLHISKDEQKQRMYDRLNEPHKTWKFNQADIEERQHWSDYMAAYEQAINETSTDFAPWYVIPANSKTNRNLLIAKILKAKLEALNMDYPTPPEHFKDLVIED